MVFIIVSVAISTLLLIYVHYSFKRNFIEVFTLNPYWIYAFDGLFIFASIFRFFYHIPDHYLKNSLLIPTIDFSYVLMGLMGFLLLLLGALDISNFILKRSNKISSKINNKVNHERRDFLKKSFALGGLGIATAATGVAYDESYSPEVKRTLIPLPKEFSHLDGITIVQLSDMHVGPSLTKKFVSQVVEQANALNPDVIVITGDLIDGTPNLLKEDLAPLANLKSKLGSYYVTGNHEYYWGGIIWGDVIRDLGITPLMNEHKILSDQNKVFAIAGVNDVISLRFNQPHAFDPMKAANGIPDNCYRILLAHQPSVFTKAQEAGFHLQLSGHTHAGQGFPWNLLVKIVYPYFQGLYKEEGLHLYINGGTGFWGPPNRLGVRGEISHLTLSAFA